MRTSRSLLTILTILLLASTSLPPLLAQKRGAASAKDPVEAAHLEFSLSTEELDALCGQTFDLLLKSGKKETKVTLREFLRNKQQRDRFRTFEFQGDGQKKTTKLSADKVFQLEQDSTIYEVAYLPTQKYSVLVNVQKRHDAVAQKLEASGDRFWEPLSVEEHQKAIEDGKGFLIRVQNHFSMLPMLPYETQYFLTLSDMPQAQVKPYIQQLDRMYEALGQSYGYAPGYNVWRGKALILLFVNKTSFTEFEKTFMDYDPGTRNTQGLCHQLPDGRVVVSAYRGDSPEFLGSLLVHETAHGYNYRYKSTVNVPAWLDEGISDWIASVAVTSCPEIGLRQREAAEYLRQRGTFGGEFFEAESALERWHYGAGSAIVHQMVQKDPQLFRLFFNGIKEGLTWQDSLLRSYGLTPEELARAYGQTIGVPGLTP